MHLAAAVRLLLIAAAILCTSIGTTLGQGGSRPDAQHDAPRQYGNISFAQPETKISDPALIPVQLVRAAEYIHCNYKDDIKELPVQLIRADSRRIALVFCRLGVSGSHRVFDFTSLQRPTPVEFPFIAEKQGFALTPRPGLMTWKSDASVFEAVTGSDMCPSSELRHTYRLGASKGWISGAASFVVVRVEAREKPCARGSTDWTIVWEAPAWPTSADAR